MKIFITGGTGFVGQHLTRYLLSLGHEVTCTGRSSAMGVDHENFHYISADTTQKGVWQEALNKTDVVVNLAGATISKRWNRSYKKLIYDSRILTVRNVVDGLPENDNRLLISSSATGYYGQRREDVLMENEPSGEDFLAMLCRDWEMEAFRAEQKGVRVATTRFGVVLGKNGGALAKIIPLFQWFLGGPLGSGKHWFPWIHIDDLASAIALIIDNKKINAALNFTSPIPTRHRDFARALGRELKRPALLPAPSFMIRLIMGELGTSLLYSQKVIPDKLIAHGFKFKFMEIETALADIL